MSICLCFFGRRFFVDVLRLIVVLSALSGCRSAADAITLLPNNPVGVVGKDMHLNCTLTDTDLTWQDLIFTIVDFSQFTHHPIPPSAVRRLDNWSVELTLRNLTQSQHRATVFCKNRHSPSYYSAQIMTVVGRPAVPMIYYHRYLNWKEFVFRWNVSRPSNGFDTKYIAWFKTTLQDDFTLCSDTAAEGKCKCAPNGVDISCHVDLSGDLKDDVLYDGNLHIKVNATNIAGSATSESKGLYIEDVTEPGPVTELSVSSRSDASLGRFVDVVSCQAQGEHRRSYAFEIRTRSKGHQTFRRKIFKNVKSVDDQGTRIMILKDLNPYTVYNLTIRSKYEFIGSRRGYWSEWSSIQFRSHEEAPIAPPSVCQCCFEVDEDSIQRTAFIYFKPLTKGESRGTVSYYMEYTPASAVEDTSVQPNNSSSDMVGNKITFLVSNKTQVVVSDYSVMERTATVQWNKSDAAVFRLDLKKSRLYQLKVNARTVAGHSPKNPTAVIIPTRSELLKLQPPSNCSVMSVDGVNQNQIIFRWNKMKSTDENVVLDELGKVTIFWCKAFLNSLRCQQPLNWMEPDPNVTSVHITLSESYEGYLFGIGRVLKNGFSSGIHWTCSYFKRNAVASPPHLVPLEIDETKVVMTLEKPNYSPKEGLVYGFNLYYSPVDDEGRRQDLMMYVEDVDDWRSRGRVTIEGLKRGTSYEFKAESLTSAGPSYNNASVSIVTRPFRLTDNALGFIIFGAVIVGILAFVGFTCCIRWPHAKWIELKEWWINFEPCMPPVVLDEGNEQQRNSSSHAGYTIVQESEAFNTKFDQLQMVRQIEDEEVESDRHQEDLVQPYSCITTDREDCHRQRLLSEEMTVFQIACHNRIPASKPEHILPSLERRFSGRSIHELLLPNLAETSEQSDPQSSNGRTASSISNDRAASSTDADQTSLLNDYVGIPLKTADNDNDINNDRTASSIGNDRTASSTSNDRTASSSDADQTSLSDDYLGIPPKSVDNDMQLLTTSERENPVTQHMAKQALQTDNQSPNFDFTNNVLSEHPKLSTNSQPAIRNSQDHFVLIDPSPSELVRQENVTRQILSATTSQQQLRSSILPELGQNADDSYIADRILPNSSQLSSANISETDRSKAARTDLVLLRPPLPTTLHRSEFEPSVVIAWDRCVVTDNTNSTEHINPFSQHVKEHHGVETSQQRILPKLLGGDLKTRADSCELENKGRNSTEQTDKEKSSGFVASNASDDAGIYCTAEVQGQTEQIQHEMWDSSSSSPFSSIADETSQTSEDDFRSGRAEQTVPRSLEDDEGIYL